MTTYANYQIRAVKIINGGDFAPCEDTDPKLKSFGVYKMEYSSGQWKHVRDFKTRALAEAHVIKRTDCQPDSAGVLGCALSLHQACNALNVAYPKKEQQVNLSEAYGGYDQFMREVMRVSELFENWACLYVNFDELGEVWPYYMDEKFGPAVLNILSAGELASFSAYHCREIAFALRIPLK